MAAITNYTTLAAAIDDWDDRDHDPDEIIGLAEAEFRLYFGPNFAKETSTAALAFTAGSAALPAGYIRTLDLTHSVYGGLTQSTIGAVRNRRLAPTGIPDIFAIFGSTIEVGPAYTGTLLFDYEGSLAGLTSINLTNWLITNAPQAYLSMCLHFAKAKFEDPSAPTYKMTALKTLEDLGIQSMVAQLSRASVTIPGATP
jgi:hypothetical protein